MCKPENAIRNMDVIGYVSAIGGDQILEAMSDPEEWEMLDASYFFGPEASQVCLNPVMYPDRSVIERCGVLHDNGDRTEALLKMWSRVKGDSASVWTYVVIGLIVAVLVVALVLRFCSNKRGKHSKKRRR